jgi:hypothetical protein
LHHKRSINNSISNLKAGISSRGERPTRIDIAQWVQNVITQEVYLILLRELSPKRKMSKIELTLNQDATQTESNNCSPTRQFYIKTAEGKRQHLTARDYEKRIQSRARSQPTTPLGFTIQEYTDTPFFCTVSEVTVVPRSSHYRKTVPRKQSTGQLCRGRVAVESPKV